MPVTVQPARQVRRKSGAGTESLQRRMKVGAAGDRYEREADRIADRVVSPSSSTMAMPPPVISPLVVQRAIDEPAGRRHMGPEEPGFSEPVQRTAAAHQPAEEAISTTPTIQRMRTGPEAPSQQDHNTLDQLTAQRDASRPGAAGGIADASVERSIQRMRAGPAPRLDAATRSTMERGMGGDLGGVRVHTSESAARAADGLNAKAFTIGQDMFFGRGQYDTGSTAGRRLIAHEAAHTVQQRGGSAGAQRVQRVTSTTAATTTVNRVVDPSPAKAWAIDVTVGGKPNKLTLPALELPQAAGGLKGTTVASGPQPKAAKGRTIPVAGRPFDLAPTTKRDTKTGASVLWTREARKSHAAQTEVKLTKHLAAMPKVHPMNRGGRDVYVLYRGGRRAATAKVMLVGTVDELAKHDGLLRPMMSRGGGHAKLDADHILELQIGGEDSFDNMWLLDASFNRSVGSKLKSKLNGDIDATIGKAKAELRKNSAKLSEQLPDGAETVKRNWTLHFKTVRRGANYPRAPKNYWTKDDIGTGNQIPFFRAMTDTELIEQGFVLKDGALPKSINVFPDETGGRSIRFEVASDGKTLKKPGFFYTGMKVTGDATFTPPTSSSTGGVLARAPVTYRRKKKDDPLRGEEQASKEIEVMHDPGLGFGGFVSRASVKRAFSKATFVGLSPISFADVRISPDGVLTASGSIPSSKTLLPGLQVPITLHGDEVFVDFPLDPSGLHFGPVRVTETTLRLGVGNAGFFAAGLVGLEIDKVGRGKLQARTSKADTVIKGKFAFDFNFVDKAELDAEYSFAKDAFKIKGKLGVKKGALPGVQGGEIVVDATRETFGLTGTLALGGVLKGSTLRVGYTPKTGLLIEGKDIPLPVNKLPGVSNAKVTARAQRNPETGAWLVSGAGTAALKAPGATGSLDVSLNGDAVLFSGRVDPAKGPAKGYVQVTATNMATDDQGNPVDGGPVGDLQI